MKQDSIFPFLSWYSADNFTESAIKVKSNFDNYTKRVGYTDGFFEYQKDEIQSFREYFTNHPNEVDSDYWKDLEMYELALDKFKIQLNLSNPKDVKQDEYLLPEIELKTQKEQIRLLHDLGILDYLTDKYPNTLGKSKNQLATLVGQILKLERASIQPTINALYSKDYSKNHPSETPKTKAIIANLNANESN